MSWTSSHAATKPTWTGNPPPRFSQTFHPPIRLPEQAMNVYADMTDLAPPGSPYTRGVIDVAVRLVVEDGLPYRAASWALWRDHRAFVPYATIQNWVEDGGGKGGATDPRRLPRLGALRLLGLHRRRRAV